MSTIEIAVTMRLDEHEFHTLMRRAQRAGVPFAVYLKRLVLQGGDAVPAAPAAVAPSGGTSVPPEPAPPRQPEPESETSPARVSAITPPAPAPVERPARFTDALPRGFAPIMAMASEIAKARREFATQFRATSGRGYNLAMSGVYDRLGISQVNATNRTPLLRLGEVADQILLYKRQHPAWAADPGLAANALWKAWQVLAANPRPASDPAPAHQPPELRKVTGAPVWRNNRFEIVPTDQLLASAPAAPACEPEIEDSVTVEYAAFDSVDLDNLQPGETRVLRRFATALANLGPVTESMPQEKIAAAVNRLRNGDNSDTPKCAKTLLRLGVMRGSSGAFYMRREFVERFEDVKAWAEGA